MSKPIVFFDLETTGTNIATDRIVHLHAKRMDCIGAFTCETLDLLLNPGIPIPAEATECHGITDEMVKDCPTFDAESGKVWRFFNDCDLAGFNIVNFDVPLLWEEFYRCQIAWYPGRIIDASVIFHKKEERTLSAAVKFYCGKDHTNAHSASADVDATIEVLEAQLSHYFDIPQDIAQLAEFCQYERRVDLAGKIILNAYDVPTYNFGKAKGIPVHANPGFGRWMLQNDFSENTKACVRRILEGK